MSGPPRRATLISGRGPGGRGRHTLRRHADPRPSRPQRSKGDTVMSQESAEILVLTDQDGNCYLLPWETVSAARVPEEQRGEVIAAIDGDTAGFAAVGGLTSNTTLSPRASSLLARRIILYPIPKPGPGPGDP